jgi:hypothetical protein
MEHPAGQIDDAQRRTIEKLLADEEAKQAKH